MLYLNASLKSGSTQLSNLTLTSVVFESQFVVGATLKNRNLTLTSVVFEYNNVAVVGASASDLTNKCCI